MEESNRKMSNVMTLSKESCTPALTMPCDPGGRPSPEVGRWKVKPFECATLHPEVFPLRFLKVFRLVSSLLIHPSFKLSVRRKTISEAGRYFKGMKHYEKEMSFEIFLYRICNLSHKSQPFTFYTVWPRSNVFMGTVGDSWVPQLVLLYSNFYMLFRNLRKIVAGLPSQLTISCHAIKLKQFAGVLGTLLANSWHFCITCQTRAGVERDQMKWRVNSRNWLTSQPIKQMADVH